MRVASDGAHLRGLVRIKHSSEETSQRGRGVGDVVSDLRDPEFEAKTSRTDNNVLTAAELTDCFLRI